MSLTKQPNRMPLNVTSVHLHAYHDGEFLATICTKKSEHRLRADSYNDLMLEVNKIFKRIS